MKENLKLWETLNCWIEWYRTLNFQLSFLWFYVLYFIGEFIKLLKYTLDTNPIKKTSLHWGGAKFVIWADLKLIENKTGKIQVILLLKRL